LEPIAMMNSRLLAPLIALVVAGSALPAAAMVLISPRLGAPDPGPGRNERMVVDFDAPNARGFVWTDAPSVRLGSQSGVAAAPAGVNSRFGFVSTARGAVSEATLLTPALRSISFYWGSIDPHNQVEVLNTAGQTMVTLNGSNFSPANGNWHAELTNRRVGFLALPGHEIGGLRLRAGGIAFEFDSIAANAVPEPASWAMLITGFGLVGLLARRRQQLETVTA
jgi:hypothetical protein